MITVKLENISLSFRNFSDISKCRGTHIQAFGVPRLSLKTSSFLVLANKKRVLDFQNTFNDLYVKFMEVFHNTF